MPACLGPCSCITKLFTRHNNDTNNEGTPESNGDTNNEDTNENNGEWQYTQAERLHLL